MAYKSNGLVPESRIIKQRATMLLKWKNLEFRKRMSNAQKGKVHSAETRKKIGLAQTGHNNNNWIGGVTVGENRKNYQKEYKKKWIVRNRLKCRLWNHRRRSLLRKLEILTFEIVKFVYDKNIEKYGSLTCYLCLNPIRKKQDSIDHKLPLSRGGDNSFENLDVAHLSCNKMKHTKTEEEYREKLRNYRR